jgi:adenine deaminase
MPASQNSPQFERYELTRVALGEAEADIAIINGRIVNVYTGELVAGDSILIKGKWIACVGKHPEQSIGPGTRVIDASGKVLVPGFIDGHTHMDYLCSIPEIVRYALKAGPLPSSRMRRDGLQAGLPGVREFLRSIRNQPVKFWFTLPPMGTISPVAGSTC